MGGGNLQEILKEVIALRKLEAKVCNEGRVSPPRNRDTLASFLQYIGKELEKMTGDSQERAKKEIFRVVSELKGQEHGMMAGYTMVPHHHVLATQRMQ